MIKSQMDLAWEDNRLLGREKNRLVDYHHEGLFNNNYRLLDYEFTLQNNRPFINPYYTVKEAKENE